MDRCLENINHFNNDAFCHFNLGEIKKKILILDRGNDIDAIEIYIPIASFFFQHKNSN